MIVSLEDEVLLRDQWDSIEGFSNRVQMNAGVELVNGREELVKKTYQQIMHDTLILCLSWGIKPYLVFPTSCQYINFFPECWLRVLLREFSLCPL